MLGRKYPLGRIISGSSPGRGFPPPLPRPTPVPPSSCVLIRGSVAAFLATIFRRQPKRPPLISPPCSPAHQGASSVAVCPAAGFCRRLKSLTSSGPPSSCWAHQMFGGGLLARPRVSAADPSALRPAALLPVTCANEIAWGVAQHRRIPPPPSQESLVTTWRLCEIQVEACPLVMSALSRGFVTGRAGQYVIQGCSDSSYFCRYNTIR